MKFKTLHDEFDTFMVYFDSSTEKAYRLLCDNVRSEIPGRKSYNYVVRFCNSVLVDVLGFGINVYGKMIFKSDDLLYRKINHSGDTYCGYWFECDCNSAINAINDIFSQDITEEFADNIGRIFMNLLA